MRTPPKDVVIEKKFKSFRNNYKPKFEERWTYTAKKLRNNTRRNGRIDDKLDWKCAG